MTRPLTSFVSSSMTRTAFSWVVTNDKMDAQNGGMIIEGQLSIEQRCKKKRKRSILEGIVETIGLTSRWLTMPASSGYTPLPTS